MGFEIPIDSAYPGHPKTLRLIALTGKPEADAYPLRLWAWAAEYARDGIVEGGGPQIELAVRWKGPPGKLAKALQEAGFIDSDGKTIHDWQEHVGRAIRIYEVKKRKQREKYDLEKGILPEESRKNSPNPRHSTLDKQQQHYSRNSTPDKSRPPEDPPANGNGHPKDPRIDEVLKKPNRKESLLLLLSEPFEIRKPVAITIAENYTWGRVVEVLRAARDQQEPGGWAIKAFQEAWGVNPALTEEDALRIANGERL